MRFKVCPEGFTSRSDLIAATNPERAIRAYLNFEGADDDASSIEEWDGQTIEVRPACEESRALDGWLVDERGPYRTYTVEAEVEVTWLVYGEADSDR